MDSYLKISEMAQLMGISTHQIRYFEKKGILEPALFSENGYRLYDLDQIYELVHILFLRALDISVKQIKVLKNHQDKNHYLDVLRQKKEAILLEIKKLQNLENSIHQTIEIIQRPKENQKNLDYEFFKKRPLKVLSIFSKEYELTAKDIYQFHQKNPQYDLLNMIHMYDETKLYVCVQDTNASDYLLKSGKYVTDILEVKSLESSKKKVNAYFNKIKKAKILTEGPLLIQEMYQTSNLDDDSMALKIMMKVKDETR